MTAAAVFQGTIHSFKTIPSRSVVSITVECPIEQLADIARIAEHGAWVAVARLGKEAMRTDASSLSDLATTVDTLPQPEPQSAGAKRSWKDLQPAAQAGIRCDELAFEMFLKEQHPDDWAECTDAAECVRLICGVHSRGELNINQKARVIWHSLDSEYQAWLLVAA